MAALNSCSEEASAYAALRKYKAYMNSETSKDVSDWDKVTKTLVKRADTDYDGKITDTDVLAALQIQYDINPTEDEKTFLLETINDYCAT